MAMKIEADLEEICGSDKYGDWAEVFGEGVGGNTTQDVESPDGTGTGTVLRSNIEELLGSVNGENDGDDWVCVFRLKDGRYGAASGGCDYTGWDCQASNRITVAKDLETIIRLGLSDEDRRRLGCELQSV